ncbi:MAG TPA: helix-turn-helix domain-containing protein [Thermomicrobiales bacterium]|nr:helix-turn-helix domain-containing protein [Thermomicrobiales bacterium]
MAQDRFPDFTDALRRARRAAGISQEELAERSGLSARAISDLERGVNRAPRRDTLEMLAEALDLSPDERKTWERLRHTVVARAKQERVATYAERSSSATAHSHRESRRSNLPRPLTPLIGRERELSTIAEWLLDDTRRIVTLIGSGDTGKTRLAIEAGIQQHDAFHGSVYFADLAPITDPDLAMRTIAAATGIRSLGRDSPAVTLREVIRHQPVLLIIDNMEQVLDIASELAGVVTDCPNLRVLATSRAPLRVRGEHEFPVSPLKLPELGETSDLAIMLQNDAVRLFTERAQAVYPGFAISNDNVAAVAQICVHLDGLPLAIELAAARVKLLSPQAMLPLMGHRLKLLAGGHRDLPARQQTLRATIDWSYELLKPEQQRLFRQLATFTGGWTLEAADAISEASPATRTTESAQVLHVIDGHSALIDQSLVRRIERPEGGTRFAMFESLREYGRDKLQDHHESDDLRERHAAYFLAMAEHAARALDADDPVPVLNQLASEHDNLRAALEWFHLSRDAQRGLCLVGYLREFWYMRGHIAEGRAHTAEFLSLPNAAEPSPCRAMALTTAAWLALRQNDAEAVQHATEALAIRRAAGDDFHVSFLLTIMGVAVDNLHRDLEQSRRYHEQSLAIARRTANVKGASMALACLGALACRQGDHNRAQILLDESIAIATAVGVTQPLALALGVAALMALDAGNPDRALALHQERLRLYVRLDDAWGILRTLHNLALVALARDQPTTATRLMAVVASLREMTGLMASPWDQPAIESSRAELIARLGAAAFEAAWAAGSTLPKDDAIAEALAADANESRASYGRTVPA